MFVSGLRQAAQSHNNQFGYNNHPNNPNAPSFATSNGISRTGYDQGPNSNNDGK
jgi:hypothetical protein